VADERTSQLTTRLERIAEKLSRLRDVDRAFSIFASSSHRYRLGPTLSTNALADFEKQLGAQLPIEYRMFLAQIGHGGAGPYYGILTLDGREVEGLTKPGQVAKPFNWTEAFNPYDWEDTCSREDVWCDEDVEQGELRIPGALYLCHYGCAIWFFLIVTGRCAGEVWRDSQADDRGIMPECGSDGRHLGFFDWYEKWLDESLALSTPDGITQR
jgi:hypothetical protein